ncbi:MAG: hypothetical protein SX243_04445 [Acidobacteriota bacterium]|nr:hypothetical protein [Acidobacteriota bacterium]
MSDSISPEEYAALEREIHSDDSPVGIDAKKTHILILHKLAQIERRLERLEQASERAPE